MHVKYLVPCLEQTVYSVSCTTITPINVDSQVQGLPRKVRDIWQHHSFIHWQKSIKKKKRGAEWYFKHIIIFRNSEFKHLPRHVYKSHHYHIFLIPGEIWWAHALRFPSQKGIRGKRFVVPRVEGGNGSWCLLSNCREMRNLRKSFHSLRISSR